MFKIIPKSNKLLVMMDQEELSAYIREGLSRAWKVGEIWPNDRRKFYVHEVPSRQAELNVQIEVLVLQYSKDQSGHANAPSVTNSPPSVTTNTWLKTLENFREQLENRRPLD